MGFFGIFSKTSLRILLVFTEKEGLIVMHTFTKFHVQENSGSRDIGQKGVKFAVFRNYLKNYQLDLVHFLRERRYYKTAYMCSCASFSQGMKILQYYMCLQSFKSVPILVLEITGKKGSKLGVFGCFSKDIGTIWFVLLEKEDIIV